MLPGDNNPHRRFFSSPDFFFLALCLIFVVFSTFILNDLNLYTPDSVRYLIWAKSLAVFDGFKDTSAPEVQNYVMHSPLYSILLAPVARMFPLDLVAAKIYSIVIGLVALCLLYYWIGISFGKWSALTGCFFLTINPLFLLFSTEVLSDVPFALFFILSYVILEKVTRENDQRLAFFFGLILAITCGLLTREIGLSLLLSTSVFFLLRKERLKALLLVLVPMLFFFFWFIRNELLVGSVENPPLTYVKIFTHHFFTTTDSGLVSEYIARTSNNIVIYGKLMADLPFFPLYNTAQFDLVSRSSYSISLVSSILVGAKYPMIISAICCAAAGCLRDYRQSNTAIARVLFLICYVFILLCYPINDLRLLFPMLVVMVYYIAIGSHALFNRFQSRRPAIKNLAIVFVLALFALPNLVWDANLIVNNHAYNTLTHDGSTASLSRLPSHYRTPFRLAGKWFIDHTDSSAIILSKWKELACWIDGRKVFGVDEMLPLENIECLIRDYHVSYIVTTTGKNGWRDFEIPLDFTKRFSFTSMEKIGDLEILRVNRHSFAMYDTVSGVKRGFFLLGQHRYAEAEKYFSDSLGEHGVEVSTLFCVALAREFGFKLEDSRALYSQLRLMPLSVFLDDAAVHNEIIELLLAAQRSNSGMERAEYYFRAAAGYWNLGFHSHARVVLKKSIQSDSTFSPAYVFGINFALNEGDTPEAKMYYQLARQKSAGDNLLQTFAVILDQYDSLAILREPVVAAQHALAVSRAYQSIGLVENGIDFALISHDLNPRNVEAMLLLVDMYEQKQRYVPARNMLRQILSVDEHNPEALDRLSKPFFQE